MDEKEDETWATSVTKYRAPPAWYSICRRKSFDCPCVLLSYSHHNQPPKDKDIVIKSTMAPDPERKQKVERCMCFMGVKSKIKTF